MDGKIKRPRIPPSTMAEMGFAPPTVDSLIGFSPENVFNPPGFTAAGSLVNASLVNGQMNFYYLGRAQKAYSSFQIRYSVSSVAIGVTWSEVGICTGAMVTGAATNLTRKGFTSVNAGVLSLGARNTTVTASVVAGDYLWAAFGMQTVLSINLGLFAGGLADSIQTGTRQTYAGRLSTMPDGQLTTLAGASHVPIQCVVVATPA